MGFFQCTVERHHNGKNKDKKALQHAQATQKGERSTTPPPSGLF
ncbi:hypothetical protein predicted by Glimmer/Critica [Acetobacter ghanensis]|uniref:Uncharacterized protein n=1 Tax=Acetobacter ghanensis TaxID=431306 RepID=A0A0U5F436_9PROT|nr:hypothetical protein predicted by Glimmer/Critica [Acetobacter ghanensis]